eukprot:3142993-Rhodomonas_salina.2
MVCSQREEERGRERASAVRERGEGMRHARREEEKGRDGVCAERDIGEGMGRSRREEEKGREREGMLLIQREEEKGRGSVRTERGREGTGWGAHWEKERREGMVLVHQREGVKGRDGEGMGKG